MINHPLAASLPKKTTVAIQTKTLFSATVFTLICTILFLQIGCSKPSQEKTKQAATQKQQSQPQKASEPAKLTEPDSTGKTEQSNTEYTTADKVEANLSLSSEDQKSIAAFINEWKTAWQKSASSSGDIDKYFAFYATTFQSGSLNFSQWKKSKTIKNQGKSWIEVWVSDIKINASPDNLYLVTFTQEYSSSNYSDNGKKQLTLAADKSGWKITREKTIQ